MNWQQCLETLTERTFHVLQTGYKSDCCFLVGLRNKPQQQMKAHKLFLSMASPIFERMFDSEFEESSTGVVTVSDIEASVFEKMLEYIYTEDLELTSVKEACEMYYVANKYLLVSMSDKITQYITANLNPANACLVLEFGKLSEERELISTSLEIIRNQTSLVLSDPSFLEVSINTLLLILSQNRLKIASELELFEALARYANNKHIYLVESPKTQENITHAINTPKPDSAFASSKDATEPIDSAVPAISVTSFTSADLEPEELMKQIREALKKIRFLNMTPKQFAKGPAVSGLLSSGEKVSIFINLSDPSSSIPMPEGFSCCRQSRRPDSANDSRIPRSILLNRLRAEGRVTRGGSRF